MKLSVVEMQVRIMILRESPSFNPSCFYRGASLIKI